MKLKMLSRQAMRMNNICECRCDLGSHRRRKDGVLMGCVKEQSGRDCSCCEFSAPPANATHIVGSEAECHTGPKQERW